jgi:hypothetical protein
VLCVDCHSRAGCYLCVRRVLVDINSQVDPAIRGDLRLDL